MNLATARRLDKERAPLIDKLSAVRLRSRSAGPDLTASEPHLSEFKRLIRAGAGTLDIPRARASTAYTRPIAADDELVEREVGRVAVHCASLNKLLDKFVGQSDRILDVGCGTGATTVAMALSEVLDARQVIGVDPNVQSIAAAQVRARGYDLEAPRVTFDTIAPDGLLPFDDEAFDLTVCVSVIEYLHTGEERFRLVSEIERVTRRGGHLLIITPSPFRLRDYHTRRLLGDWRREAGYPWASPPWQLEGMLRHSDPVDVRAHQIENGLRRRGLGLPIPARLGFLGHALPWQKLLAKKR